MIERSIGRDVALGATSLLMLGGTLLQTRPINAENQGKTTPNQDNHSLYIDNLVEQAIENARLNIPSLGELQQNPAENYLSSITFTDRFGTRRLWGIDNARFGIPPNETDRGVGTIDNWNLDRMIITSYIQANTSLYPEINLGRGVSIVISGAAVDVSKNKGYLATANSAREAGIYFPHLEIIGDINNSADFLSRRVITDGLPTGGYRGGGIQIRLLEDSIQLIISTSVIASENGIYQARRDRNTGDVLGSFTKLSVATPTPEPTATLLPSPTSGITRASGFVVSSPPSITWRDGSMETAYAVFRFGSRGAALAPNGVLSRDSTSYRDTAPSADAPCYIVFALRGTQVIANSDLYCVLLGIQSPFNAPEDFRAGLTGNMANIGFRRSSLIDAYVLLAFGAFGQKIINISANTESALDDTRGISSCYILVAGVRGGSISLTNGLCAIPGVARGIN